MTEPVPFKTLPHSAKAIFIAFAIGAVGLIGGVFWWVTADVLSAYPQQLPAGEQQLSHAFLITLSAGVFFTPVLALACFLTARAPRRPWVKAIWSTAGVASLMLWVFTVIDWLRVPADPTGAASFWSILGGLLSLGFWLRAAVLLAVTLVFWQFLHNYRHPRAVRRQEVPTTGLQIS